VEGSTIARRLALEEKGQDGKSLPGEGGGKGREREREREEVREGKRRREKETAGPLHPRSYYNRSSESLLKRVYTGLGVDSGRAHPSAPTRVPVQPSPLSPWFQPTRGFVGATLYHTHTHTHTHTHIYIYIYIYIRTHTHTRAHTYIRICTHIRTRARSGELCVQSNAYLIVACMNSESRSTRGYEPDPS